MAKTRASVTKSQCRKCSDFMPILVPDHSQIDAADIALGKGYELIDISVDALDLKIRRDQQTIWSNRTNQGINMDCKMPRF